MIVGRGWARRRGEALGREEGERGEGVCIWACVEFGRGVYRGDGQAYSVVYTINSRTIRHNKDLAEGYKRQEPKAFRQAAHQPVSSSSPSHPSHYSSQ